MSICRSHCLVLSDEEEVKILTFLIQVLWKVATFKLLKGAFPQENIFLHIHVRAVEEKLPFI